MTGLYPNWEMLRGKVPLLLQSELRRGQAETLYSGCWGPAWDEPHNGGVVYQEHRQAAGGRARQLQRL